MLEAIIQPKWWATQEHRSRVFTDVLDDWETLIGQYSCQSGKTASDRYEFANIREYAPRYIVGHLRGDQTSVRCLFPDMAGSIREIKARTVRGVGERRATAERTEYSATLLLLLLVLMKRMKGIQTSLVNV